MGFLQISFEEKKEELFEMVMLLWTVTAILSKLFFFTTLLNITLFTSPDKYSCMVHHGYTAWEFVCPFRDPTMLLCRDVCCWLEPFVDIWRNQGKTHLSRTLFFNLLFYFIFEMVFVVLLLYYPSSVFSSHK